jgi:hypothetical protein
MKRILNDRNEDYDMVGGEDIEWRKSMNKERDIQGGKGGGEKD